MIDHIAVHLTDSQANTLAHILDDLDPNQHRALWVLGQVLLDLNNDRDNGVWLQMTRYDPRQGPEEE